MLLLPKPPVPTIDPVSVGENIHVTGTGIPNYWIHLKHERVIGGGTNDLFQIENDGKFRSLNPLIKVESGDKITISQSQYEFDDEDLWSDNVVYIVN